MRSASARSCGICTDSTGSAVSGVTMRSAGFSVISRRYSASDSFTPFLLEFHVLLYVALQQANGERALAGVVHWTSDSNSPEASCKIATSAGISAEARSGERGMRARIEYE